ncbi:phage tail sheath C-terminal domain-containing protein [Streptomyces atriruber]|uniref:Phage tail sheath C-terminal domain-containing protein n=1 Tax=Streptomyces atriruber TaxID=545121 RepID=A0ABV3C148_9ACTN
MPQQQPNQPRTATTSGRLGPDIDLREPFREPDVVRGAGHGAPFIHGVHTSVAAFIGDAPSLPGKPAFVRHPLEFIEAFSSRSAEGEAPSFVHDAVLGHFRNGGGGAWVLGTGDGGRRDHGDRDRVAAYRAALARLERLPEISLVVAPDLWRVAEEADGIARAIAGHCSRVGHRVALLHTRQGLAPADVRSRPFGLAEPDAQFVAVHYPWVTVTEVGGHERLVPPSGHVSGMCCRADTEQGVHTTPVGSLVGVVKQERELTERERESVTGLGVNCLRFVQGQGVRALDAQTLSTDPDWASLGVRRLVNYTRASLEQGTRWAAFDRNTAQLRALIRQSTTTFLKGLWRQGALPGETAGEAFEVTCDDTNNTAEDVARGHVNLDVGLAAVRPAEFVTFRVQHDIGSGTI